MSAECGMKASPAIVDAVGRARAHAPFLSLLLDREPALAAMLDEGGWPGLESARAEDDGQSVGTWLRVARRRLALLVALGDLAGHPTGRASCRERVCLSVLISVVAVPLTK